jgi:hypothetical protein
LGKKCVAIEVFGGAAGPKLAGAPKKNCKVFIKGKKVRLDRGFSPQYFLSYA